ncbi:MAG: response regulator transcription factor [Syntrophobacteraceae bacterium]|jgi:FixJ family two-component response regulator|nr:response regulator transcription factor [Syntrophobacteraceae bacterium]
MIPKEECVFIIDDDPSVRNALSFLLRTVRYAFEVYSSAEEFLAREPYDGIGCIVLDVRMTGMSGLDLQEELMKGGLSMPIIFITGHGDIPMTVRAMKRGAVDFLPKPFEDAQLLTAIQLAIEKHRDEKSKQEYLEGVRRRIQSLTAREYEILRHVIAGLLNKQIAFELKIAEQTVKIHRGRIMQKLGVTSVSDLVRMAEKAGVPLALAR